MNARINNKNNRRRRQSMAMSSRREKTAGPLIFQTTVKWSQRHARIEWPFQFGTHYIVVVTFATGCTSILSDDRGLKIDSSGKIAYGAVERTEITICGVDYVFLVPELLLYRLAVELDATEQNRSPSAQYLRAAEARLRGKQSGLYPSIRPSTTIPIYNSADPSVGFSNSHSLWDGGRIGAAIDQTEDQLVTAAIDAWIKRDIAVYVGLTAYIEIDRNYWRHGRKIRGGVPQERIFHTDHFVGTKIRKMHTGMSKKIRTPMCSIQTTMRSPWVAWRWTRSVSVHPVKRQAARYRLCALSGFRPRAQAAPTSCRATPKTGIREHPARRAAK